MGNDNNKIAIITLNGCGDFRAPQEILHETPVDGGFLEGVLRTRRGFPDGHRVTAMIQSPEVGNGRKVIQRAHYVVRGGRLVLERGDG